MFRVCLRHPQCLLSVSDDGQSWQINDRSYQLLTSPVVLWRYGLVVPLTREGQRQWFWLWWFQLSATQLAQLRCLSIIAADTVARD